MKEIALAARSALSKPVLLKIARPAIQASAALLNLTSQFRLKKARLSKKNGHA